MEEYKIGEVFQFGKLNLNALRCHTLIAAVAF